MQQAGDTAMKRPASILLIPTKQQLLESRQKLPVFEPHDLRSLVVEAKSDGQVDFATAFLRALRRRNQQQLESLLRNLGIDPSRPDAWKVGFLLLASYHHGAGQLAWFRRRTNANSATWKPDHDLALLREVITLMSREGLSESRAVEHLAKDARKRALFPYRRRGYSSMGGVKQRAAALRRRLQKLKAQSRDGARLAEILSVRTQALSPVEQLLYALDAPQLVLPNKL
jgi:hypothetical protein